MEVILVRHGETDANRQGILMGSVGGPSLNATGQAQAAEIGEALKVESVVHLYTSPARRARETAGIISKTLKVPLAEVNNLAEIDVGRLEGLTKAEVNLGYASHTRAWERDAATARHPGGETLEELQRRVWDVLQELGAKHAGETIVVVSHLFVILAVVTRVLEMPLRHLLRIRLEPGAMVRIELTPGKSEVVATNETWHLRTRGRDAWATANDPDSPG